MPSSKFTEELSKNGRNYRRNSLAATLHANIIGLGPSPDAFQDARRRFSNVSDVVSRKISRTIGWRPLSVSVELTVSQGSSLCAQYIRNRLKRSGIFHRKLGLKRMGSSKLLQRDATIFDVYPQLTGVGAELEKMHPNLFVRIGRQIGCGTFGSEQQVTEALIDISREMLRSGECTWSKVIALYAVAGGIAVDCVRQGKPEFIPAIQRTMAEILEEDIAVWIQANGGWSALGARYRPIPQTSGWQITEIVFLVAAATIFISVLAITIRILLLR